MPLDGYFLNRLKTELNILVDKRVRKIKMNNKRVIALEFNTDDKGTLYFDLNPNKAHLKLSEQIENTYNHHFITSLKQYLLNASLKEIRQLNKDRVLFFTFVKFDPFSGPVNYTLVFEVMGRTTHLILMDSKNIIIDSFNKVFNEDKRSILPKIKYETYPSNKHECSFNEIIKMDSPNDIFNNCQGFSKQLASFVYNKKVDLNTLKTTPILYKDDKLQFHAFDFNILNQKEFNSLSSLLTTYYSATNQSTFLEKIILKQISNLEEKLISLKDNYHTNENYISFKEKADVIYSSGLDLTLKYSEINEINLDYNLTLNENAQKFYKLYHKQKGSLKHLEIQIQNVLDKLNYFKDVYELYPHFKTNDLNDLKTEFMDMGLIKKKNIKKEAAVFYEVVKEDNTTYYIGKSLKQNEYLFSKIAKSEDLWFHIKDYPGPHVFMKGELTNNSLLKGASLAIKYSKRANDINVSVNYAKVKDLKRITTKPGFYLSVKNYKTINI